MSFTVPALIEATAEFGIYEDAHPMTEWTVGSTIHCTPSEPFDEYDVDVPGDGGVDFAADPGSLVFFGSWSDLSFAPFYTITAKLTPPSTFNPWFDPPICRMDPPFEYDAAGPVVEGSVAGSYVDDTGAPIDMSITVIGAGSDAWTLEGNLVNPDPVWPMSGGNTFGSILFTASQVAAITGRIDITSGPPSSPVNDGLLQVELHPYKYVAGAQGHIMGWA